jgi:hypothetical protein
VILCKFLELCGSLPDGLVKHVNDKELTELMKAPWQAISENDASDPFEQWPEGKPPNLDDKAKRFILRMTNLSPAKRAAISDIMADPYWTK